MKQKICVVTGTRAEFGLMYWLINFLQKDQQVELQLIVTGMHLSPEFGLTYRDIEEAGFKINKKIEMLLSSDTEIGIGKSMGLAQISFAEAYQDLKPDVVVLLGDRFEIFCAASAAMVSKIPVAHLHGGEATEGVIDEPIRHSITKMSHLHFTATETYRRRVIQLGEKPDSVFNVGTPGIDNIKRLKLLSKKEFEDSIGFKLKERNIIITYHPVTLENNTANFQFNEILKAISTFDDIGIIFTKPNSDTHGRIIIKLIDEFVSNNSKRSCSFLSLGQVRYLSALKHVDVVLGNSSSGLIEAPSFKVATIDIGDRQKGRIKAKSVLECEPDEKSISNALDTVFSADFQRNLETVINPYGEGGASEKIVDILKGFNYKDVLKKKFYDIEFET